LHDLPFLVNEIFDCNSIFGAISVDVETVPSRDSSARPMAFLIPAKKKIKKAKKNGDVVTLLLCYNVHSIATF
jgi:hypothetical protein